ncbi:MAG TPA: AI-2E family transporter [Anaerolineae bacterium]|nr:AI-2E family transporter [Anaerolineae bacterium]
MDQDRSDTRTLVVLLTIAVSIYLIEKLGQALLSLSNVLLFLALAWLIAFSLQPLVKFIHQLSAPPRVNDWQRKHWGDKWADRLAHPSLGFSILIVYTLLVAGIVIIILAIVPLIVEQVRQLAVTVQQQATNLPESIQRVSDWLNSVRDFLITRLQLDPSQIPLPAPQEFIGQLASQLAAFGTSLVQFGLALATGIAQFLLVVFLSVMVMIDGGRLAQQLMLSIPKRYQPNVQFAINTLQRTFGGFLRGTLLQGIIYGLGVIILMTILGIGSAIATGVATGILMLIPIVGGPIGLFIPLLVGLLQGSPNTFWLILVLVVYQVALFNFITPRLLSKSLRMPSLLVILSLLIGAQLLGIWGFIFAVPISAAIYTIGLLVLGETKRRQDASDAAREREKALP